MSEQIPSPATPAATNDWLGRLVQRRREIGYVLLALAVAFLIAAAATGMRAVRAADDGASAAEKAAARGVEMQSDYLLLTIWAGCMVLVMAGGAIFQLFGEDREGHERDTRRLLVMTLGGLTGLATAMLGMGLAIVWRDTMLGGWNAWRGAQGWKIWVVIFALFGGLALTFASIQLARADERTSPGLRRLLYGFNAVFTGLLLAAILVAVNLLAYTPWGPFAALGKEYSWAQRNLYEISPASQKILDAIQKPTKVYVILPSNDPLYYPAQALLENCKEGVNDTEKFDVEFLSPDRDRERVARLGEDYHFDDRAGILVVYGTGAARDSAFIKYVDLQGANDPRGRGARFNGEQTLMTELSLLEEGKSRPTIYITQGNGELDVSARPGPPLDKMDVLKKNLEFNRYKVRPLQFVPADKPADGDTVFAREVPADAGVLIIAGPRDPFPKFALDAIADYLDKRHGKLMVFFDVATGPDKKTMVRTGLEELLKKYNVEVGDDRLMHYDDNLARNPVQVQATFPRPTGRDDGSLAGDLSRMVRAVPLLDVRTVYPAEKPAGPYRTEMLLEVGGNVWSEKDLATEPRRLLTRLSENREDIAKRITATRKPVSIAVTVAEVPPGGPHAPLDPVPRMVVFGDATWLSNAFWSDQGMAQVFGAIFGRILGWLRERPVILDIQNKNSDTFMLPTTISFGRTVFLPGALMMVGIIGLGAGVWVVRRR